MPTEVRHSESGKVKNAQDGEVESYLDAGYDLADGGSAPNRSDPKDEWVSYAESQGYDESEGLTKAELVERYG